MRPDPSARVLQSDDTTHGRGLVLPAIALVLGLVLSFGLLSDYTWDYLWLNILFPPFVGLLGLLVFFVGRRARTREQNRARFVMCLPSLLGGVPTLLVTALAIVPPFLLTSLFWLEEKNSAILIQAAQSPNGLKTAEVYYLPIGGYIRNGGRIEVHLKDSRMPFVKRDIFTLRTTRVEAAPQVYLVWKNDNEIHIPETGETIKIDTTRWKLPRIKY
ncbi:MAG: hypothetical protein R6W69_00315 [Anaerolineales bacterium]